MSRYWINLLLSVTPVICCFSSGGVLHAEILRLKATAVVDSPVVRLGDVADVLNADADQVARMEAMSLQPAPAQGRTLLITISQIRSRLQALGVDLSQLELTGKSQVRVSLKQSEQRETRTPVATQHDVKTAEEKVERALSEWVKRSFSDQSHYSVTVRIHPEDIGLVLKSRADSFRFPGLASTEETEQEVALKLSDSSGSSSQARIYCRLQKVPEILATKYTLNKGTVIRADDLIWIKPEQNQAGITDPRLVIGRELTRTVHQSNIVRSQDLIKVPLIRDGAIVTVSARRGAISVKREMRARGTGGMGDPITLIALEGRDRLTATIIGYNQAEVNYRPTNGIQRNSGIQFISGSSGTKRSVISRDVGRNQSGRVIRSGGIR
ncbi:flagellar basal body P-ring formation chaperone FlgA [uncultured Gimesia sp.]|uniref:flagellar basal body P-ring formation chaperone FlgA n=1 Tax=uncultured Gimesia sp. TaxID=1678688 RepID=UPI00260E72E4|nr:flagellar basal body P-ring formation chaperone FlgA [uncultured Gimesia sp.]